ncbi:3-hydroxyacyl-CoA dehydrogenase NAD-binding domain-containing protein [Enterocloster hominis (ex Hitch et al. 2024)]|uniref:3-hydroxyacyl-CoA dehydrogenase NAD-binding domain-containing protein n=1 Tax=Enterocloster hominis (ex Hitch et al. 2024) TaxID=1917870 RepID=UPI002E3092CB|nr:3-hydroxyacyl-CoA dehydrogenase NAD-binding domain-containing protein [Lachnoclostridium pacaense]
MRRIVETKEEGRRAKRLIETSIHILKAVDSAKMVVEAVEENVEVKQNLFAQMDEAPPLEVPYAVILVALG